MREEGGGRRTALLGMRGLPGLAERPFSPNPSLPGTASSHTSPVRIILTASSTPGSTFSLRTRGEPGECNPCAMTRSPQGEQTMHSAGKTRATGPAHYARKAHAHAAHAHAHARTQGPGALAHAEVVGLRRGHDVVEDLTRRLHRPLEADSAQVSLGRRPAGASLDHRDADA